VGEPTVKLHLGDCRAVMPSLAPGSVDCVVTDPPYGVGKAEWDDRFPTDWIDQAWRLSDRMLVMPGNRSLIEAGAAIGRYKDCICLRSLNGMTRSPIAFGKWIPVLACGEWKWKAAPNVLEFSVRHEYHKHPSIKPFESIIRLIQTFTEPSWTILDPFMGSGTIGEACLRSGRSYVGIEINPGYFEVARRRLIGASLPLLDAPRAPAGLPLFPEEGPG
jgi:DNA modification methylase